MLSHMLKELIRQATIYQPAFYFDSGLDIQSIERARKRNRRAKIIRRMRSL